MQTSFDVNSRGNPADASSSETHTTDHGAAGKQSVPDTNFDGYKVPAQRLSCRTAPEYRAILSLRSP